MRRVVEVLSMALLLGTGLAAYSSSAAAAGPAAPEPAAVNQARLAGSPADGADWITNGHDWTQQRYSPLIQINAQNVGRLGLLWYDDLHTYRGVEATPLEIDGVLYNISAWDITIAYDATTGKKLWTYDPKVSPDVAQWICCGPVSRGVAAWHGKIIIATLDGRLIALDARTGKPVWSADTVVDRKQPITITGAPRIAAGNVVIGNSGGDLGARGYMSAYNADTGQLAWRFWITPGEPGKPDQAASDSIMPTAAATWAGNGGNTAAVATTGMRSPTTPGSISSTSAPAMAPRIRTNSARRARMTTCFCARSSPSMPAPASTGGTTRRFRPRNGTTTAPRR